MILQTVLQLKSAFQTYKASIRSYLHVDALSKYMHFYI